MEGPAGIGKYHNARRKEKKAHKILWRRWFRGKRGEVYDAVYLRRIPIHGTHIYARPVDSIMTSHVQKELEQRRNKRRMLPD